MYHDTLDILIEAWTVLYKQTVLWEGRISGSWLSTVLGGDERGEGPCSGEATGNTCAQLSKGKENNSYKKFFSIFLWSFTIICHLSNQWLWKTFLQTDLNNTKNQFEVLHSVTTSLLNVMTCTILTNKSMWDTLGKLSDLLGRGWEGWEGELNLCFSQSGITFKCPLSACKRNVHLIIYPQFRVSQFLLKDLEFPQQIVYQ